MLIVLPPTIGDGVPDPSPVIGGMSRRLLGAAVFWRRRVLSIRRSGGRRRRQEGKHARPKWASARAEGERRRPGWGIRSWFASKGPVFRFVLVLGGLFGAFNVFFYAWLSKAELFEVYLGLNAQISAADLRVLGHNVTAVGTSLGSSSASLHVRGGCDAMQSAAFLIAAVLASPVRVSLPARIPYMLLGGLFVLLLNVVRIVSLYFSGAYYPRMFDVLHIDLWQPVFILFPLVLWLMWLRWSLRQGTETPDVPT